MNWKLTTLIENHENDAGRLTCEHGLSVLIEGQLETGDKEPSLVSSGATGDSPVMDPGAWKPHFRMLMDTGQSGSFYENAQKLAISLSDLDCVLISHAHYDHANGLFRLIKEEGNPRKLYVGKHFFRKCYHRRLDGRMKYIGIKYDRQMLADLGVHIEEMKADMLEIAPGVTLHRNFDRLVSYEELNPNFFYQEEDSSCGPYGRCMDSMNYFPDSFEDEIALALDTEDGLFVVVGCSHPGIVNVLKTISERSGKPICGVIGGTHLMDADRERVMNTVRDFKELGVKSLGVSHCTGDENVAVLQESFGDAFFQNSTGTIIYI